MKLLHLYHSYLHQLNVSCVSSLLELCLWQYVCTIERCPSSRVKTVSKLKNYMNVNFAGCCLLGFVRAVQLPIQILPTLALYTFSKG